MQVNPLCFGAVVGRLLTGAVAVFFLSALEPARGSVLLFDSFGLGTTNNPRLDSGGLPVTIVLGTDLSGIRAEIPNTGAAVWTAPGGHGAQSWAFTVSSADPNEAFSPFEPQASNNVENGTVTVLGGTIPTFPDALLDFNPPAGAIKVSADVLPGADPAVGTAIGLSSSRTVLNSNFWRFGQAWLVVRGGTNLDTRSWELHMAGTRGPTACGEVPFTSGWFRLELSCDPAARLVFGAINGVPTPILSYGLTNVTAVGLEGGGQAAENFAVETSSAGQAVVAGVNPAAATTFAFDRNNTFGWRFTPAKDIDVSALGYFDGSSLPGGTGAGLSQPHDVGIYRVSDSNLLASVTVPAGTSAPLEGNFRYQALAAPLWLTNGTTYVMAGFALSASPDQACAATNWTMAPGILYANSPTPTPANPTSGTSQYLVSARGNPPAVLTYPGVAQGQLLPVFAANFRFTLLVTPAPQLTSLVIRSNAVILGITNLTAGAMNFLEKSADLQTWQPLGSFMPCTAATNLVADTATNPGAMYRLRVVR
jgi:hypothetical protein